MSRAPFATPRACLRGAARLIQFQSEVAIAVTLAAGVAAGVLARNVLPDNRGQAATLAAPADGSDQSPRHRQPPARPAGPRAAHAQAVDVR